MWIDGAKKQTNQKEIQLKLETLFSVFSQLLVCTYDERETTDSRAGRGRPYVQMMRRWISRVKYGQNDPLGGETIKL